MAEREHPAAKAGRFVRAAGRASAAAAREFERQAATRPPAPAPTAAARPAPPPPMATHDFFGRIVFYGFVLGLVMLALVALRAEAVIGHEVKLGFRIVATAVLLIDAYLLTSNWNGANQRLGQRLLNRVWGPRGAVTRREKTFAHLLRDGLILIGIAFLAGGVYELLNATVGS